MSIYNYLNKLANAEEAGYNAYWEGKPEEACPYHGDSDEAIAWCDGWQEGYDSDLQNKIKDND